MSTLGTVAQLGPVQRGASRDPFHTATVSDRTSTDSVRGRLGLGVGGAEGILKC
jgi:hypothetical protein